MSTTTNKKLQTFLCKLFRIIKFFFLILLKKANLELKVTPTNRNSSAFLLCTSKTPITTTLLFVYCVHIVLPVYCQCIVVCAFADLSIPFSLMLVVIGLLVSVCLLWYIKRYYIVSIFVIIF